MILLQNLRSDATKATLSLYKWSFYLIPGYLVLSPPASLVLYKLSGLAATELTFPCENPGGTQDVH